MLHGAWIEREAPLARCPLNACRRGGACRHTTDQDPCRRLHETKDALRIKLANKFARRAKAARRRDPEGRNSAAPGTPEFERRLKLIYETVRAADQANSAREMAEIAARKKQRKKPASAEGA